MAKMRKSTLNKQDDELFRKIVATWNLDKNLNEVLQFMEHLETNYPLANIDFLDYLHSGPEVDAPEPIYFGRKGYHIARVYLTTCCSLACYDGDQKIKREYYEKLKKFCWKELKVMEFSLFNEILFSRIASVIFDFYEHLVAAAMVNKDNQTLIRGYKSVLRNISYLDGIGMWTPDALKGTHLSAVFERLVNEAFNNKDDPEKVIIRHEKVLRAYTDAISYAFDNEPCLIIGETGTGKERIAKIIHELSDRKENNLRTVNFL